MEELLVFPESRAGMGTCCWASVASSSNSESLKLCGDDMSLSMYAMLVSVRSARGNRDSRRLLSIWPRLISGMDKRKVHTLVSIDTHTHKQSWVTNKA